MSEVSVLDENRDTRSLSTAPDSNAVYDNGNEEEQRTMVRKRATASSQGNDRLKAFDAALANIEKGFGKGAVMHLRDGNRPPIQVVPSGNIAIDVTLGLGGFPRGRIAKVYGPESSGKITVALHTIVEAQRQGGITVFIDAEHALDPVYARKLGVDTNSLLVSQLDIGEQALEITDMLVRSGAINIIAVGSVAVLTPKAKIDGGTGDPHAGLQARLMSQTLRKMTGALSNTGTTAIFINQLREKIDAMFGSPETTTGGKALKFYASVHCDVRRVQTLKDGQDAMGNHTCLKVVENKVSPPFKQAEFDIIYGEGISREGSLTDMGVDSGVVKKSGSWFIYEGDQPGQGKEKVRMRLRENPEITQEIEVKIRKKLGVGEFVEVEDETDIDAPVDVVPDIDFNDLED